MDFNDGAAALLHVAINETSIEFTRLRFVLVFRVGPASHTSTKRKRVNAPDENSTGEKSLIHGRAISINAEYKLEPRARRPRRMCSAFREAAARGNVPLFHDQ